MSKIRKRFPLFVPLLVVVAALAAHQLRSQPQPAQPMGEPVGDETCRTCHEDVGQGMEGNVHARIQPFEVQGHRVGCEGCHGAGSRHVEEGGDPQFIRTFDEGTSVQACMECHDTKHVAEFRASIHALSQVDCMDCHAIHTDKEPLNACQTCHADEVARFQLPSHHPVREGKLSCASCHDSHAATEKHLKTRQRVNDLCFTCHASLEGPFVFEHEPVVEDCRTCHTPHGSVANNLLTANEPMLCLQCHDFHFHAGYRATDGPADIGGIEFESPHGALGFNMAFTTKCTDCHSRVHGSDLPSQTVPGRGEGLTQ
jgi:DmsE family decaheme c-type cytochrome